jgi:hypothetical protein
MWVERNCRGKEKSKVYFMEKVKMPGAEDGYLFRWQA